MKFNVPCTRCGGRASCEHCARPAAGLVVFFSADRGGRTEPGERHHLHQSPGGGPARRVVLDEHLGPMAIVGLVLILGGSWLVYRVGSPSIRERKVRRAS